MRLLGRLAVMTLEVEDALDLEPLPDFADVARALALAEQRFCREGRRRLRAFSGRKMPDEGSRSPNPRTGPWALGFA
jgi:hypothetical protein